MDGEKLMEKSMNEPCFDEEVMDFILTLVIFGLNIVAFFVPVPSPGRYFTYAIFDGIVIGGMIIFYATKDGWEYDDLLKGWAIVLILFIVIFVIAGGIWAYVNAGGSFNLEIFLD